MFCPQLRRLKQDEKFEEKIKSVEKDAWITFKDVTQNFLGNYENLNYATIVEKILENLQKLGCNMNFKKHFLHFHLEYFSENLDEMSMKNKMRDFTMIKKCMEKCYQRHWNVNTLADCC